MALRNIRQEGDPILRKISKEIPEITPRILELAADMLETMHDAEGAGLAAPQVGVLRRLIIVDVGEGPIVMVNPTLISQVGEKVEVEGCLSIPGFAGTVKRPEKLVVRYLDLEGNSQDLEAEGFLAKAVCHEIDHLNGILFRDLVIEEVDLTATEDEDSDEYEEADEEE